MPPYAVIHPFASRPDKTWPAERFVEVARKLSGLEPVFLAGPGDDTAPFESFRVLKNEPLARVKSLMSGASLFIGNDSGPAHIAAAFGVPVVVLFGSSDPRDVGAVADRIAGVDGPHECFVRSRVDGGRGAEGSCMSEPRD